MPTEPPFRVRLTSDALNSHGSRVLTSGIDISQYERNPVLLYMHYRGTVIGYLHNFERTDDEITAEMVFDEASEISSRCRKQWEFGSLRMVSVGLNILEWSDAPEHLVPGQTYPTITRSKLTEVSVVDIGANDDALRLSWQGREVTFSDGGYNPLPLLDPSQSLPNFNSSPMDLKSLSLLLGLPDGSDEPAVLARLNEQLSLAKEAETLRARLASLTESWLSHLVETAIREKRIDDTHRAHFVDLGKKLGVEALKATLAACAPRQKLSTVINERSDSASGVQTYARLGDVPEAERMELRSQDPARYKQLYRAEYGFDCEID